MYTFCVTWNVQLFAFNRRVHSFCLPLTSLNNPEPLFLLCISFNTVVVNYNSGTEANLFIGGSGGGGGRRPTSYAPKFLTSCRFLFCSFVLFFWRLAKIRYWGRVSAPSMKDPGSTSVIMGWSNTFHFRVEIDAEILRKHAWHVRSFCEEWVLRISFICG